MNNRKPIRVLIRRERCGNGQWAYVAIGIEEFVATQGPADSLGSSP